MVGLRDESLGVSAIGTKAFQRGGQTYGHVIDPRSGNPVQAALLAAVVLPSATDTDALSTALLTLGQEGLPLLQRLCPRGKFLVAQAGPSVAEYRIQSTGFDGPTDESCVHRELGPQRNPPRQGV
jgi:thiamine biosynthesis lipoprotein